MLDYGADILDKIFFEKTVLHFARAQGHEAAVLLLLEHGANLHAIDNSGNTVMHAACEGGNIKIASLFLKLELTLDRKTSLTSPLCNTLQKETN